MYDNELGKELESIPMTAKRSHLCYVHSCQKSLNQESGDMFCNFHNWKLNERDVGQLSDGAPEYPG